MKDDKRITTTLKAANKDFAVIEIPMALLLVDISGNIFQANSKAELMFNVSKKLLCTKNLKDFISSDSPLMLLIKQVLKSQSSATEYGLKFARLGTKNRLLDVHVSFYTSDIAVIIFQERTLTQKIGNRISQNNHSRSITGFSSMLSHEIKNPLSGISGAAQLLHKTVVSDDKELVSLILNEVERIRDLLDRVDILSDSSPLEKNRVNIHEVLDYAASVAKTSFASDCNFVFNYDPSLPSLLGNRNQLIQVFVNLFKNASESSSNCNITVTTGIRQGISIKVSGTKNTMKLPVFIEIVDDGPGISENILPYLFDPFVSTKKHGSGLGLPLASHLIESHGGIIEVSSRPNKTLFTILLPLQENQKEYL